MNTGVRLHFETHGHETNDVPVRIEIFNASLRLIQDSWLRADESREFPLKPGVYSIRASVSSGQVLEQVLPVQEGKVEVCDLPLHQVSPHESQEWAYLTQPIDAQGAKTLSDEKYQGLWVRVWERKNDGIWKVRPFPDRNNLEISSNEDGVSYKVRDLESGFYALQVGGPHVPWKIVALPSTYEIMILIRPSSIISDDVYPLDVVVSSNKWQVESLLSLMQRGDMSGANDLVEKSVLAETLLYSKMEDSNAAAIGGYFLLRVGSTKRLGDWIQNLDNRFPWLPDGAIIHAWQLIREIKLDKKRPSILLTEARLRLLEAVRRGFPLYTEGLRLLRDGLIMFDQRAKGDDKEIRDALEQIGNYAGAADWSVGNTTFTGKSPDKPSTTKKLGTPSNTASLVYVYDVPLLEALKRGSLQPGEELVIYLADGPKRSTVNSDGTLKLEDGRVFKNLGELHAALTGKSAYAWMSWHVASKNLSLGDLVQNVRL